MYGVLQTDSYLEQLTDPVAESEMSTQTDPFRDRPATPLFIPKKAGLDATTQIEAGDLFDFDFEVKFATFQLPSVCSDLPHQSFSSQERLVPLIVRLGLSVCHRNAFKSLLLYDCSYAVVSTKAFCCCFHGCCPDHLSANSS